MDLLLESDISEIWEDATSQTSNLVDLPEKWNQGEKTLRSIPVLNVFDEINGELGEGLKKTLIGLDAKINVYDDIVDSAELSTEEKVRMTKTIDTANALMYVNTPDSIEEEIRSIDRDYREELFNIPVEEHEGIVELSQADEPDEMIDKAQKCYQARSNVINGFVDIAAAYSGLDPEERVRRDMQSFIAKKQIIKDVQPEEVRRDIEDEDLGPSALIVSMLNNSRKTERLLGLLYNKFDYTEEGKSEYGEILKHLEPDLSEIHSDITEAESAMKEYAAGR